MYFREFIRNQIKDFLETEYPVYFFWDRNQPLQQPYIVYQVEDLEIHKKLDNEYRRLMDNAIKVYEYSEINLQHYGGSEFKPFLPRIDSKYISCDECDKEIDVLFYGHKSARRQNLIEKIENEMGLNVLYIEKMTLDEMKLNIARSKYVLSIGTYSNLHNDLMRVTPALNLGANILLEETQEVWYNEFLKNNFSDRIKFI